MRFFALLGVLSAKKGGGEGRQYIPKGTVFSKVTLAFVRNVQHKLTEDREKKLYFSIPKQPFFKKLS